MNINNQQKSIPDQDTVPINRKAVEQIPPEAMTNKTIPEVIRPQAEKALGFYPELKDVPITFKFKKNIKKSTMQAQPKFKGIFKNRHKRGYVILISETFQIEDDSFNILDVEDEVMIGWLGHELGHVMDYKNRSAVGMIIYGIRYLLSSSHIREVERSADTFAIEHGMGDYIIATKNFILNNSDISEIYKARIRRLYLSPEEIMEMVNELEDHEIHAEIEEETVVE
ncbi:MAG TPA: hypothetical protein VK021_02525 [Flavobacteriaceae bacterium]|nr:hypothetical protein [Flavobacteriaceae bacterium]